MGDQLLDGGAHDTAHGLVDGTVKLDLGSLILTLRSWPTAHSDNDLSALDEQTKTLFAGDLVFLPHIPVLDGSIRGWLGVIDESRKTRDSRSRTCERLAGRPLRSDVTSRHWRGMFASLSPVASRLRSLPTPPRPPSDRDRNCSTTTMRAMKHRIFRN
jgi:hypothetical protein